MQVIMLAFAVWLLARHRLTTYVALATSDNSSLAAERAKINPTGASQSEGSTGSSTTAVK